MSGSPQVTKADSRFESSTALQPTCGALHQWAYTRGPYSDSETHRSTATRRGSQHGARQRRARSMRFICQVVFTMSLMIAMGFKAPLRTRTSQEMRAFCHQLMSTTTSSTEISNSSKHTFSVAPMMEYTDRYQRKLTRLMSAKSVLYTGV